MERRQLSPSSQRLSGASTMLAGMKRRRTVSQFLSIRVPVSLARSILIAAARSGRSRLNLSSRFLRSMSTYRRELASSLIPCSAWNGADSRYSSASGKRNRSRISSGNRLQLFRFLDYCPNQRGKPTDDSPAEQQIYQHDRTAVVNRAHCGNHGWHKVKEQKQSDNNKVHERVLIPE